jgi:glycine/sarcosine N-methyltransferase
MGETPDIARFYDALADDYDAMTLFDERFAKEVPAFRELVRQYAVTSALDAGCGTGFHSILLASLGVQVTGIDVSEEMVLKAGENARIRGVAPRFVRSEFASVSLRTTSPVDAVFCLGNSLAHLTAGSDLTESLRAFSGILKPGGHLIIQLLNYQKILAERKRIINVRQTADALFVRFYDFGDPLITFNILKITNLSGGPSHILESVKLRPLQSTQLTPHLISTGFEPVSAYGSIALDAFDPAKSADLVLVARKSKG